MTNRLVIVSILLLVLVAITTARPSIQNDNCQRKASYDRRKCYNNVVKAFMTDSNVQKLNRDVTNCVLAEKQAKKICRSVNMR